MKGVVAFANPGKGRYAVRTANGFCTILELLEDTPLEVGTRVSGYLQGVGDAIYAIDGDSANVRVEDDLCTRSAASH
jgi:hypothetical protein